MGKRRIVTFIIGAFLLFAIINSIEKVGARESCVPNWNCTVWKPINCPRNETQVRQCSDLKKCETGEGKPSEMQDCTFTIQFNKGALTAIIVLAIITFAIVLVELIRRLREERKRASSLPETRYTYTP
ncbi:hypothetical protein HYW75_02565 [Candidatus Pacearchaeota archaeon]|nr:hypothetical protein [Candidatus Pacearchaeota archaeon]